MFIDKLELFLVRLPLAAPTIVNDRPIEYCETVFSRLEGEGQVGWGEVAPGNQPYLTSE